MNWEDERYVRLYTRDTGDWCALSWDGQALLMQLLRKADRSGVIQLGRRGRTALPNMLFHGAQADRIDVALTELLDDGCVELHGTNLVIPNFTVAQEAKQSDKLRQQESRARRLAQARSDLVSKPTNVSHAVTDGHESSQPVTPSVPSVLNQPSRAESAGDASHPPPSPRVVAPDLRHEHGERMTPPSPPRLTSRPEPPAGQQAQLALVTSREAAPPRPPKAERGGPGEPDAPTNALWEAYERAMMAHPVYGRGKPPLRNRKVNGLLAQLLKKMPREDAPEVIAFYVRHPDGWYIRKGHSIECLLKDAEKIYGEWSRDQPITATTARQHEQTASNPGLSYLAELEAERNRKK